MASMKQKYSGKTGSFGLDLAKFAEQAMEAVDASLQEIVIEVAGSLIRMSPVDTGRFRGNWQFSLGSPDNGTSLNVDPTGAETLGRIATQVGAFTAGQAAYITNSLPYAIPLEYGHSTQAPGGMVRITLARFQQIVDEAVRNNQI